MLHTLVILVEDKPGVLNRVASLFRRRTFNIESLTVGHSDTPGLSRMTIMIDGDQVNVERLTHHLYKLVNVVQVDDLTNKPMVSRDLAMVKVSTSPANRSEVIQMVEVFRAHIVDVTSDSLIAEITGDENKITGFIEVLKPMGIIELVRTGAVAMARGSETLTAVNGNGNGKVYNSVAAA